MRKMENGLTKMTGAAIEFLVSSTNSCIIILPHFLVQMHLVCLYSLSGGGQLNINPPLAIAYELACRVRSNSKLKYLAMFKSAYY